jgi:tetratricopeptide (TPR) repeat protein
LRYVRLLVVLICAAALSVDSRAFISVSSKVTKPALKVGESFTFTLRFEGLPAPIPQPFLPQIEGASVKGQYQSAETSRSGQAFLYHYIISPVKSGKISLSDFSIRVENQTLRVGGFTVEVGEGPPAEAAPQAGETVPAKDEIFLEGRLAKNEAFEGEAVIYTLHLLTRESIRNFEFVQKSEFDGFRKIEIPSSLFPPTAKVTRNSKIFLDATILKCILYPLKSGNIRISPFLADIKVQARGGLSNPIIRLKGGEEAIKVIPLPAAPGDFRGAIGNFESAYAADETKEAKVGEPFTVDVRIRGEGSLPGDPFPAGKSPFFSSYPSKHDDNSSEKEGKFKVDRTYHLSWIPMVAGSRALPDMNFVYFDPLQKQFKRSALKSLTVTVLESAKTGGQDKPNILPLLPVAGFSRQAEDMTAAKGFWFLLFPFLFTLSVFFISFLMERFFLSPEKRRLRILTSKAVKEFKSAGRNLDARKSRIFHNHLKRSLEAVLEIKTGEPISSLTMTGLRDKLTEEGVDPAETEILIGFAEEIDAATFSNEQPQKTELRKRLDKMRDLIKRKRSKSVSFFLLALLPIMIMADGQSSILTSKAADEYDKGNFSGALKYYKIVEDSGAVSAQLYYNMGNSYFESGKLPHAILYYKRALKTEPSLAAARSNLALARNLLPAKASPYEPSPLESFLLSRSSDLFFYTALILLLSSNLIYSFLRMFNFYFIKTIYYRIAFVLLFSGLLAASMFFMSIRIKAGLKDAIALETVQVYQKPDPALRPLTTLPEGSELYVLGSSGQWSNVKWGEGEGWAYSQKIGTP